MNTGLATRDRILEAATALFWRNGYSAVSVDAICAAAEVKKGSFYHAFPSKADLLLATIEHVWESDRREILAVYDAERPIDESFKLHMEWFGVSQRRLFAKYGFVPGSYNMALDLGIPDAALEVMKLARQEHLAIMKRAIQAMVSSRGRGVEIVDWLTGVLGHLIEGVTIDSRLSNALSAYDTLPESVFALMGLAAPPVRRTKPDLSLVSWPGALAASS